ncbi:MAG: hypothetical protein R2852_09680 [Bacteroidia bacterium]
MFSIIVLLYNNSKNEEYIYLATLIFASGTFLMVSCGGGSNAGNESNESNTQTQRSMIEK